MLSRHRLPAIIVVLLLVGCHRTLAPSPNLYVHVEDDPFADVPIELRTPDVYMLYVTDRAIERERNGTIEYGSGRTGWSSFGHATVEIGRGLTWEQLVDASCANRRKENPRLKMGTVRELGRFPVTPGPLVMDEHEPREADDYLEQRDDAREAFHVALRRRLALTPRKEAFVFIHGFSNTFEDAAFRLAEMWHFLGREGVPVLYSWPAGHSGLIRGYTSDREAGEFTIYHLKQFFEALAACEELEKVHIIAHSRGTDIVTTALRELVIAHTYSGKDPQQEYKIGNVVLAAPDIDNTVSQQRNAADHLQRIWEHLTVYITPNDQALASAEWLLASPTRLGRIRPEDMNSRDMERLLAFPDGEIVDARITTDLLGHSYFINSPAVFSDLILVLRGHDELSQGQRPLTQLIPNWYIINDDYPMEAAPLPRRMREK